jgi:dTDP-4-dehydrorhamnose reductase
MTRVEELSKDASQILVVGCRGMLGTDLMEVLEREGLSCVGMDLPDIDITRKDRLQSLLADLNPWLAINCAAYTAVDRAEQDQDAAFAINRDGPENLATTCAEIGAPLIHISTDYVFDGSKEGPYREDDPTAPLGVYGRSKWEGEAAVRSRLARHVIVRTAWLYGLHGPNFVKTMLRVMAERETVKVVVDQHGCPTWTGHLAEALATMAKRIRVDPESAPWGTYHYCGFGATTWHAFAVAIAEEARSYRNLAVQQVVPITTAEYPTPAQRPANSVLDCGKIQARFGASAKPWRPTLARFLRDLLEGTSSRSGRQ